MAELAAWLERIGLGQYAEAFAEAAIDLDVLPDLSEADLADLGLKLGDRKRLLKAIAELSAGAGGKRPAPPADPPLPTAERRQLTVLFCDLIGSTELSRRLDPEDMGDVMRSYHGRTTEVIRRWGGHVAKYLGDGVLAYFGWPQAHEDDTERAVRAGLALVGTIADLDDGIGRKLAVRIGIATGPVVVGELVGEGVSQEQAVVGETPNLAARLQGLAAPGSIVIAASTRRLVGGLFELGDLGPQRLKGFAEPLSAWRVEGEAETESRFEATRGRRLTPLVGREHELGLLLDRWSRAKDGEGQVVLLSGEAGIGKSRLIRALRERIADDPHVPLPHYGSPHHTSSAFHPVIQHLERAAGFARDDPPETRLDKLEALLRSSSDNLAAAMPLIATLMGLDPGERYPPVDLAPQRRKQLTLEALVGQVEGLARERPVLAIYEDVHWFDPSSLEAIGDLLERVSDFRAMVLVAFRPDFAAPWRDRGNLTTLSLARLSRREGAAMMRQITGGQTLGQEIEAELLTRTDGIPLFVEELTKAVIEAGDPIIPASLHDSLMARLDRLGSAKKIAQVAACIGRDFNYSLLASVTDCPKAVLLTSLDELTRSELIFRHGTPPMASYTFKHALVQDAARASLLRRRRQQLHVQIALALERVEAEPELLAQHFAEGGLPDRAIRFWLEAGERAARRSANAEAITALGKGLELLAEQAEGVERNKKELAFQLALGPILMAKKGLVGDDVQRTYYRARRLCELVGSEEHLWSILFGLSRFHLQRAEVEVAKERACELSSLTAKNIALSVPAWWAKGAAFFWGGDLHWAQQCFGQVAEIYDADRHHALSRECAADPGVVANAFLAHILWMRGYPEQALNAADRATGLAQTLNHQHSVVWSTSFSAKLRLFRRDVLEALPEAAAVIDRAEALAFPHFVDEATATRGWALVEHGDAAEGARLLRQCLNGQLARGQRVMQHWCLAGMAAAQLRRGYAASAIELISEAQEVVERTGARWWESELHRLRGRAVASTRPQAAQRSFVQSIEVAQRQDAKSLELRAAASLARLWAERGERRKAHDLLAPVYGWFTEGFDTQDLKDARELLDQLA